MPTTAQLNACAANAQHSTGPRTPEGKGTSSRNALKFGLYSQANLLPGEDPADLDQLTHDLEQQYRPQTPDETLLLHDLVRGMWLERRYSRIETEIVHLRFAALSEEDRRHPLGAIYIHDAEGPNLLDKIARRLAAAQRQTRRARAELRRLQAERCTLELDLAPPPEPANPHPVKPLPSPSVRFDRPAPAAPPASIPTPIRTPHDCWDNPALRL